jgi:zinc finger SWIM domain-containing protein 3
LHDDDLREEFRTFLYDCCSIEEIERKWVEFLERNQVTSEESWLHQMYQMRNLRCAAYQQGWCFLGLRSNHRGESLNSRLHTHLYGRMSLFGMLQHYEHCLSVLRRNEVKLDAIAMQSVPFTKTDASNIEKYAAQVFTPMVYDMVKWNIQYASKCVLIEVLDGGDLISYLVVRKDNMEKNFQVDCEFKEDCLYGISCSCRKLECRGTPCSHIFYVLRILEVDELPKCCIPDRWTMSAKSASPPTRKNNMYDYSTSLGRYRKSHATSSRASQCIESFQCFKRVLQKEASSTLSNVRNERMRYGPVLPQMVQVDSAKVLDPLHVKGQGAPKKRLKAMNEKKGTVKCSRCEQMGRNRRTCSKRKMG